MNWHKKNIAMLVGLLFMSLQMFGQYKISGHIKNHGGRILLLVQDATGKYDTLANSLTANGKFYFTGKVRRPIAAEIRAVNKMCIRDSLYAFGEELVFPVQIGWM